VSQIFIKKTRLFIAVLLGLQISACTQLVNIPGSTGDARPAGQSAAQEAKPSVAQKAGQSAQGSAAQPAGVLTGQQKASDKQANKTTDQAPSQTQQTTDGQKDTEAKNKDKRQMPWQQSSAQQSARQEARSQSAAMTPEQMQRQAQERAREQARQSVPEVTQAPIRNSERPVKRVIIDPVTGLYVDTDKTSSIAGVSKNMNFENRQTDLEAWPFWELEGRIGVTVANDAYNGSLVWEQEGDKLDFRFRGPLGFGGVRIHGVLNEEVRVKTTRGEEFFLHDVENDMQDQLGWSLPINSLRYWSLGITDPEQDAEISLDEQDLLVDITQGEWLVHYDDYAIVDGVSLPRKFKITGPNTKIRMLVKEWSIPGLE